MRKIEVRMNISQLKTVLLVCTFAALTLPMAAAAQNGPPPGPALDKIAAALGVSEDAVAGCMPRPAQGQRPERPDASAIATCLQPTNASVTTALVNQTLETFKPDQPSRRN